MTIDEILNEFSQRKGYFPKAAVEEAIAQQEVITPYLLDHLKTVIELGDSVTENKPAEKITLFAVYLLGQFRETEAYPLIINMVSSSPEAVDYLIGDTVTEGLHQILASVYDGNLTPLKTLIENDDAGEYVRGAGIRTLIPLFNGGIVNRETIHSYFSELFRGGLTREYNHVWNVLCACTEEFGFDELLPDMRQAFREELTDPYLYDGDYLETRLLTHTGAIKFDTSYGQHLIEDTVAELQDWIAFQASPRPVKLPDSIPRERFIHTDSTLVRETPKTGRNDPCPCDSGKKFKKCCGR